MSKLVKRLCPACGTVKEFRADCKTCGCGGTNPQIHKTENAPIDQTQIELKKIESRHANKDATIKNLAEKVLLLEKEKAALIKMSDPTPQSFDVRSATPKGQSESVAVAVWSDHHIEEEVRPGQVANKNTFNLEIARRRFDNLVAGTIAWFNIEARKTTIKTFVLALLGDFISGSIHEDLAESNLLAPVDAIYLAQGLLIGGIQALLKALPKDVQILVVCHGGNHGRMTKDQRISTEIGNSLEQYMYMTIRDYFVDEPRLVFQIATGYHSFVRFFEGAYEIRFHHGHQINYGGGVGGITIPVNKAIGQWNKAHAVNLDVFGHFHTRFDGGNFICNGSLIGYNAYAVSIKASYEKPSQTFFLVNREYGEKTMVAPIFVGD
jgi:hypothetical protein